MAILKPFIKLFRPVALAGFAGLFTVTAMGAFLGVLAEDSQQLQATDRSDRVQTYPSPDRLVATRAALAITSEQEEAWSAFARAAGAFVETVGPSPRGESRAGSSQQNAEPGERTLNDLRAVRSLESMVERSTDRAEAARELRAAIHELSIVLTTEQVVVADRLLSEFLGRGWSEGSRDDL